MRLKFIDENEYFRVFFKPPLLHSVNIGDSTSSCVEDYKKFFPTDCRKYLNSCESDDMAAQEFGLLYRLDFVTSGLILFAKSRNVLSALRSTKIEKKYSCICTHSDRTPDGLWKKDEYLRMSNYLVDNHKLIFQSYFRNFNRISVRPVLDSEFLHFKDKKITASLYQTFINFIYSDSKHIKFDVTIFKGYRHQIRSVLSSLYFPILGDEQYGGLPFDENGIKLICRGLKFFLNGKEYDLELKDEI